jgi:hypothetical protein
VHSYRILQLADFVFCPCTRTRTSIRLLMLESKPLCHLFYTHFSLDQEPVRQLHPNSYHGEFVLHPSACLLLLSSFPSVQSLGRCWDPRHRAICYNTVNASDPEPERQSPPKSFHRTFVLNPSACRLLLLSSYLCVSRSAGKKKRSRH